MSISFINRKFEALAKKEQAVNDFYDPLKKHDKQHPHIQDLRDDYREDLNNYGFSKYQLKKDIEARQNQLDDEDEINIQNNYEANTQFQSPAPQKNLARPMTAHTLKTPQQISKNQQRPITAPGQHNQIDDNEMKYFSQTAKESKYWRNTKKFDTCFYFHQLFILKQASQNQIRNQSALQRIMLNQSERGSLEQQEFKNKRIIEDRINLGKLGIGLQDQKLYQKKSSRLQGQRKKSPTEKDKHNLFTGFQEQKQLISQKSAIKFSSIKQSSRKEPEKFITRKDQQKNNFIKRSGSKEHYEEKQTMTINIISKNSEKLDFLRKIEKPILQQKFLNISQDYQNEDLFSMKWDKLPLSQVVPFHLAVIEVKTMNMVNICNLMLNSEIQLIYIDQLTENEIEVDFQFILHQLYLKSEQVDIIFPIDNLYYILVSNHNQYFKIYQQSNSKSTELLFERFYYQGSLQIPITTKVIYSDQSFLRQKTYLRCFM